MIWVETGVAYSVRHASCCATMLALSHRTLEMIQFYFQGWATEEERMAHLDNLKPLAQ